MARTFMNNELDIKCAKCFDKHLLFYRPEHLTENGESLRFSVKSNDVRVWLWIKCDYPHLINYFQEMARDWKGWNGMKTFRSSAGEMELRASSDQLGHIKINVILSAKNPNFSVWSLETSIMMEAGQLEELSHKIKRLV